MTMKRLLPTLGVAFVVAACESGTAPVVPDEDALPAPPSPDFHFGQTVVSAALGGGTYRLADVFDIDFYLLTWDVNGHAFGRFRHRVEIDGLFVDFEGRVTCLAVDSDNGRAWIGGVITRNRSTDPGFIGGVFDPGKDIWFRALDTGRGSSEPDRTTFVGFEGGGGIITSAEYCEAQIWPDDNARTWPVTRGHIVVRP